MTNLKDKQVKQIYEVYRSDDSIFSIYKKDSYFSGKSLEEITDFFLKKQKPACIGDSYSELEEIIDKKGKLIYKFRDVPGHKSVAMINNLPVTFHFYKIVPKLKLEEIK